MMGISSWFTKSDIEREKRDLKTELTHKVMSVERRRSEVESVARDIMSVMNRKEPKNEET